MAPVPVAVPVSEWFSMRRDTVSNAQHDDYEQQEEPDGSFDSMKSGDTSWEAGHQNSYQHTDLVLKLEKCQQASNELTQLGFVVKQEIIKR